MKEVHVPYKEGRGRVHIGIAGPMQAKSAGGKECEYIIVDDYTRVVYMWPLRLKSEAPEVFKVLMAKQRTNPRKDARKHDNARELCMGEMKVSASRKALSFTRWYGIVPSRTG